MIYVFFAYCSSLNLSNYNHPLDYYKDLLEKEFNSKKQNNPTFDNVFNFLENFSIFFQEEFISFFKDRALTIKNIDALLEDQEMNKLMFKYFKITSFEDVKNNPLIVFAINTYTFSLYEMKNAFKIIENYEKEILKKKNASTIIIDSLLSNYSIPEKFKQNSKEIETLSKNFYKNKKKMDHSIDIVNLMDAFTKATVETPSLTQKSMAYRLVLRYFSNRFQFDTIKSILCCMNKVQKTLKVPINLSKENFNNFETIYKEKNKLNNDFKLTYGTIKTSLKKNEIDFMKYLVQIYPKTAYENFLNSLLENNTFNKMNLAKTIIDLGL